MYKKSDNTNLTTQEQEILLKKVVYGYLKVYKDDVLVYTLTQDNYLKDVTLEELRYVPDQGIIGQAVARRLSVNLNNVDNSFSVENCEVELFLGSKNSNNELFYINYGRFIVQHPENENTTDNTYFEALDYMSKLNITYVDNIEYPCTLLELLENVCEQGGVELGSTTFPNSDFIVENNQFVNNESLRTVVKAIAMCAYSWARVSYDNKLYIDFTPTTTITKTIDNDGYYNLDFGGSFGPVNKVTLANSQIEGNSQSVQDDESIEEYGLHELVIYDNPFAYTDEKKLELIEAGEKLFGFEYKPLNSVDLIGYIFLNCEDTIQIEDMQGTNIFSYVFNHTITYEGTTKDNIECPALTETETKYSYTPEASETIKNVQIIVDRAEGEISIINEKQIEANKNITEIKTNIDRISSTVAQTETLIDSKIDALNYENTIQTLQSLIQQNSDQIEFNFINLTDTTTAISGTIEQNQQLLEEYIRFKGALIELGRIGNDFTAELSNTELAFKQNGSKIAYISNNKLYITDAEVKDKLQIGRFAFVPRVNGNLSFTWVG